VRERQSAMIAQRIFLCFYMQPSYK
jgi:hypothetical protein